MFRDVPPPSSSSAPGLTERLQLLVFSLSLSLFLTGGVRTVWKGRTLEFSQIDALGGGLMVLSLLSGLLAMPSQPARLFWESGVPQFWHRLVARLTAWSGTATGDRDRGRFWTRALALWILFQSVVYLAFLSLRFRNGVTNAFDHGFVEQAVWSTARLSWEGPWRDWWLHSSLSRGGSYFGEHFSPILALLSPLYLLAETPWWIFLVQTFVIQGSGFLCFRLFRSKGFGSRESAFLTFLWISLRSLRSANEFDLREDIFFLPLTLVALQSRQWGDWLWKQDSTNLDRKYLPFSRVAGGIALVAMLFVKESGPLILMVWGGLGFIRRDRWGWFWLALGAISFFGLNRYAMPYFAGAHEPTVLASRLSVLGSNFSEIFQKVVGSPVESLRLVMGPLADVKSMKYLWVVLGPWILWIAFAPGDSSLRWSGAWAPVLGFMLMNLLITQRTVGFHYECVFLGYLAAILGQGWSRWVRRSRVIASWWGVVLLLLTYGRAPVFSLTQQWIQQALPESWIALLNQIPSALSLSTNSSLQPHGLYRRTAQVLTNSQTVDSDVVALIEERESLSQWTEYMIPGYFERASRELPLRGYVLLVKREGLSLWCKKQACEQVAHLQGESSTTH